MSRDRIISPALSDLDQDNQSAWTATYGPFPGDSRAQPLPQIDDDLDFLFENHSDSPSLNLPSDSSPVSSAGANHPPDSPNTSNISPPANPQTGSLRPNRSHSPFLVDSDSVEDEFADDPFAEDIFDFLSAEESPPPHPRRSIPRSPATNNDPVVDLTISSPILQNHTMPVATRNSTSRKRRASTPAAARPNKTARASSRASPSDKKSPEPEVVDLVDIENDEDYADFKAKQQAELVKQQQKEEVNRPVKLAEIQCIICMDNPTDLTVTHCGHLFCSECLHQALHAGNGGKKSCPVCRSAVVVPGAGKKPGKHGLFVLEMKLMTSTRKGKQPVRD